MSLLIDEYVYDWVLELAETALMIDENNVEDVEDFFRVWKMRGLAIDILKCEKGDNKEWISEVFKRCEL